MMHIKVIGILLLGLSLCYSKKSHHHKHHPKKNATSVDLDTKSIINGKPKPVTIDKMKPVMNENTKSIITEKTISKVETTNNTVSKKQSLGMPLNNMDEQGLGGEPVGHLDASEGVGGLGGADQEGMPIGMGAGAEPLGMSKGKETEENGGMQGNEERQSLHGGNEDQQQFQDQVEGEVMDGRHGGNMMNGHSSGSTRHSGNRNGMMGPPHSTIGNMNNNYMGNGEEGGDGENGGNFMAHDNDDARGPKKDPLGGDIKLFNDEFKNEERAHGTHSMQSNDNHHGDSSHAMPFSQGKQDDGEEHMGRNDANGGNEREFNAPNSDFLNGDLASLGVGKGNNRGVGYMEQSNGDSYNKGPKKDDGDMKSFNDEHKMNVGSDEREEDGHSIVFMNEKKKHDHMTSQDNEPVFANPSPSDIGKALNGNLAALDSVNIQGDSDVADMVRKATHQKDFANNPNNENNMPLMDPGYSTTTRHFFGNGEFSRRTNKENLNRQAPKAAKPHKRRLKKIISKDHKSKKIH